MSIRTIPGKFVECAGKARTSMSCAPCTDPTLFQLRATAKRLLARSRRSKNLRTGSATSLQRGDFGRAVFNGANPNQFVVFFTLDITPRAAGKRLSLEEVAVYTVKNEKITREQFFYDGTH